MSKTPARTLVFAVMLASLSAPAIAQAPPAGAAPPPANSGGTVRDPKACAPSQQVDPSRNQRAPGTTGQSPPASSENLGDKLARTDGVLCPPSDVDPAIRAPAPNTDARMPVIPPPGSPGGDPSVRPK